MTTDKPTRERLHTRVITVEGFRRSDGLYEIEGRLRDSKTYEFVSPGVQRAAGAPIHEMSMRLVVDSKMLISQADALSLAAPTQFCKPIAGAYSSLVGMSMTQGFTRALRERFGGVAGCTHHTELLRTMAISGEVLKVGRGKYTLPDITPHHIDHKITKGTES